MIVQYLPFQNLVLAFHFPPSFPFTLRRNHLTIRRRLLGVSKQWRDLLSTMPSLWRNLDFSAARRPVRMTALRTYVKSARNSVTHATLFRADKANEDALKCILGNCRKLEYLRLVDGVSNTFLVKVAPFSTCLTTLIIGKQRKVRVDCMGELLDRCESLRRAEFHCILPTTVDRQWKKAYPNLEKLLIHADDFATSHRVRVKVVRQILVGSLLRRLTQDNRLAYSSRFQTS